MAELDVSGSFLITVGRGQGPETWVVVSVNNQDGTPVDLKFPKHLQEGPVHVFVALSAMLGPSEIPLYIVEVQPMESGFCGLRVQAPSDLGVKLEDVKPSSLGIVVTVKKDRGQALACDCGAAQISNWHAATTQKLPKRK